jgi:hypothetical protein
MPRVENCCGAAREILQASQGAELLIVGSRGHGGFSGLLLGSVSSASARHARCPVLIIHGDTASATSLIRPLLAGRRSQHRSEAASHLLAPPEITPAT